MLGRHEAERRFSGLFDSNARSHALVTTTMINSANVKKWTKEHVDSSNHDNREKELHNVFQGVSTIRTARWAMDRREKDNMQ